MRTRTVCHIRWLNKAVELWIYHNTSYNSHNLMFRGIVVEADNAGPILKGLLEAGFVHRVDFEVRR